MRIPQLARYNGVVEKSYNFVMKYITEFPVNPISLINKFKWEMITYQELAKKNNCSVEAIEECFGKDAYSIFNCKTGNYKIIYNLNGNSEQRINFSLAHEIGHIILNHLSDFEQTSTIKDNISENEYKILEKEANCFARNILSPAPLCQKVPVLSRFFKISNIFNISSLAKNTRLSFLQYDLNYLTDTQIIEMQNKFLEYSYCVRCNYRFTNKYLKYCPVCGKNNFKKGIGFMFYQNEFEVDENKKVKMCPICENEEIEDGDFCKICGFYLFNRCSNFLSDNYNNIIEGCGEKCSANARYCHKCGSKTTFFNNNFLCDYTKYKFIANDFIQKNWEQHISSMVNNGKIVLYTNLLNSKLIEINNDTIGIYFSKGLTTFGKTVLEKNENFSIIKSIIKEIYNKDKDVVLLKDLNEIHLYNNSDNTHLNIDIPFNVTF